MELLLPVLFTALIAGLLGSGHCFGMCGGIAGSLGAMGASGRSLASFWTALVFNLGRIFSYALVGGTLAYLAGAAGAGLEVPQWSRWLRLATALFILLIGLRYLLNLNALASIEKAGSRVWRWISPVAMKAASKEGWVARWVLGLCWGLLPCGLVYTMMLTAASTGYWTGGALVMLAFGVGTLPSMLGITLAAPAIAAFLSDSWTRRIVGLALVLLAIWAIVLAWPAGEGVHHAHMGH